jgi:anti-anti-sigma factor
LRILEAILLLCLFQTNYGINLIMPIDFEDETDNLRRISITERLDIQGTEEIATKFAALTASAKRRVVLDLTNVTFLASIGIRAVITNAKALQQRGGKMVLFVGNNKAVTKTLEATGIDVLIPMFADAAEAEKAALA